MKHTFLLLLLFYTTHNHLIAQTSEEKSMGEYVSGQINKFSSLGAGKAQGLKIHCKYPKSWESIAGERPHIIRKFIQSDGSGTVMSMIMVNKQEQELTQEEIAEFMTTEGLKSIIGNATYIASNCNLKIEGLKAGSIEYARSDVRGDQTFYSYNLDYLFPYKQYLISLQFMVIDKVGETKESLYNRYKKAKPLFAMMFNSIVIDNIWEK